MSDKSLLSLPVLPTNRDKAARTDRILESFVHERKAATASGELAPFIERWKNVWQLQAGDTAKDAPENSYAGSARQGVHPAAQRLLMGDYNKDKVLEVSRSSKDAPSSIPADDPDYEVACHLMLPLPLMNAHFLARHYGVCSDLAMVRIYLDTYPELKDEGRPFRETVCTAPQEEKE